METVHLIAFVGSHHHHYHSEGNDLTSSQWCNSLTKLLRGRQQYTVRSSYTCDCEGGGCRRGLEVRNCNFTQLPPTVIGVS